VHVDPGVGREPGLHLAPFVGGVVVHDQVQLALGVGAGDLLEEPQELLMPVPRPAGRGDLAGRDLQGGEQGAGPVPDVVVGAFLR